MCRVQCENITSLDFAVATPCPFLVEAARFTERNRLARPPNAIRERRSSPAGPYGMMSRRGQRRETAKAWSVYGPGKLSNWRGLPLPTRRGAAGSWNKTEFDRRLAPASCAPEVDRPVLLALLVNPGYPSPWWHRVILLAAITSPNSSAPSQHHSRWTSKTRCASRSCAIIHLCP
jgi:hypothetical protein